MTVVGTAGISEEYLYSVENLSFCFYDNWRKSAKIRTRITLARRSTSARRHGQVIF